MNDNEKKCPFCAEIIKVDATKCKHCGEWLNKSESSSIIDKSKSLLSGGLDFIKEQNKKRLEKKYSHLYEPTDDRPLVLNDLKIYGTYIEFGNKYSYDDVAFVLFEDSVDRMNGVRTRERLNSIILLADSKDEFFPDDLKDAINLSYQPALPMLRNKEMELIIFMNQYLAKRTFQNRLQRYLHFLKKDGFYEMGEYRVTNTGDVLDENGKFKANIIEANTKNLIEYKNTLWEGLKSASYNPHVMTIYEKSRPSVKIFGLDFTNKVRIKMTSNQDVNDYLLVTLLKDGKIL